MNESSTILANLPCSVELPAGTGKTETIARLVQVNAADGKRSLVLTHTHAGVDVLRRRMKRFGVPTRMVSIRTLDSWCFDLISSFPLLSGMDVGEEPDWSQTRQYHVAGKQAVDTRAVAKMLGLSYDLLIVDEYQDCQIWQHNLVVAISNTVPTCVFGDRMQGLFFFGDSQPVDWERDVQVSFPKLELEITPWRWLKTNPELGIWLLQVRSQLLNGTEIDLSGAPISIYANGDLAAYRDQPRHPETVVAISRWPNSAAILASRLGGAYTMIEEIEGRHLKKFAEIVDNSDGNQISAAILDFAVSCAFGPAAIFPLQIRNKYRMSETLIAEEFPEYKDAVSMLNRVMYDPSIANVRSALLLLSKSGRFSLYRREAWFGVLEALRLTETSSGLSVLEAVIQIRNKMRLVGRRPESKIVGRPLLIKGLEFGYAVIDEPESYNAHELYVCLTRGSKGIVLITNQRYFNPPRPIENSVLG